MAQNTIQPWDDDDPWLGGIYRDLVATLRPITAGPIGPDSRIWHDLKIAGMDALAVVRFLEGRNVDLSGCDADDFLPAEHAPYEYPFLWLWRRLTGKPDWREVRVRDLVRITRQGVWDL